MFTSKFAGTGPSSYKKNNLPCRGLTKFEKHWSKPCGLKPLDCWYGCSSLCLLCAAIVEASATSWSLVQRSPTGVCLCVLEASTMRRQELSCRTKGQKIQFSSKQNSSKRIEWRTHHQQNDSKLMYRKCNEFDNDAHRSKLHSSRNEEGIKFGE